MSGGRFKLEDLSPAHQAEVLRQLEPKGKPLGQARAKAVGKIAVEVVPAPARRLRQSQKPLLNKLETRFLAKIEADYAGQKILCQAVRLELARGQWYKPDFIVCQDKELTRPRPIAYEVKGPKVFRGGFENLKTAARVHPWIQFFLVWEDDNGAWQQQEVLS